MKNRFIVTLVRRTLRVVVFVLALTGATMNAQETKKDKSCAGGCCLPTQQVESSTVGTQVTKDSFGAGGGGDKEIAIADPKGASMQDHNQHQHGQNKKNTTAKKEVEKIQTKYTCPMHPEIKSSKPGTCPKCKMDLVEVKKEKKSLMKQKMQAMKDGKYNCCLQEPCDECLKAHGSCDCKNAVKNDKPVCNECYGGWQRGEGDVSGKTFKDIKKGHEHKH